MLHATAGQPKESPRKAGSTKASHGSRTRPTNNQLLYRATFQWEHYRKALYGHPKLPDATEACASVTSAFLQVIGVLFEVERLREDGPRNILRLLSTNTRRTKVVELSSGTHRVPDELKRHSIGDGEGGQYSTNLDRNRYGSDDQYLATVVRYNLEYLDMCPCLVDVTILDAKGGDVAVVVSAGQEACTCNSNGHRHQMDARQRQIRTIGSQAPEPEEEPLKESRLQRERSPSSHSGDFQVKLPDRWLDGAATSKSNGGSELFDALLMAAAEPQVTSRPASAIKPFQPRPRTNYSPGDDSNADSEGKEDSPRGAGEVLRRSSRKSVKLFDAAALEREQSGDSDEGMSSHSLDEDNAPRAARGSVDDWDRGMNLLRGRRSSNTIKGASAVNLSKLNRPVLNPETKRLQHEVRRMQQQLQATALMLEEARAQEAEARQQAASLQTEIQLLLKKNGTTDAKTPLSSDNMFTSVVLKEAQETILRLEQEKALLCTTLTAAGLPMPTPPPEVPTPQRNGESPLHSFPATPLPPLAGASAFSVPLAVQAFPAFQQYQRVLASLPQSQLRPPSSEDASGSRIGTRTPSNLPQKPSAILARSSRQMPSRDTEGQSGSPGKKDSNSPPATQQSQGTVTPVKRKLEEDSGAETRTPPPSKERLLEIAP